MWHNAAYSSPGLNKSQVFLSLQHLSNKYYQLFAFYPKSGINKCNSLHISVVHLINIDVCYLQYLRNDRSFHLCPICALMMHDVSPQCSSACRTISITSQNDAIKINKYTWKPHLVKSYSSRRQLWFYFTFFSTTTIQKCNINVFWKQL